MTKNRYKCGMRKYPLGLKNLSGNITSQQNSGMDMTKFMNLPGQIAGFTAGITGDEKTAKLSGIFNNLASTGTTISNSMKKPKKKLGLSARIGS